MLKRLQEFFPQQVFIIGGASAIFEGFEKELKENNQHYMSLVASTLLVDHTREIVNSNSERASEPFFVVCYFETLHSDAHQLLLKTLEEPGENKFYCLITPHPKALPQTIQSRAHIVIAEAEESEATEFTQLSTDAQFAYITKHFGGEAESADKKSHALRLLDELERSVAKKNLTNASKIYDAKKMLLKANLSPKQVLEFAVTVL